MFNPSASGYLSAGHCTSSGTFSINGNTSIAELDRAVGGYLDRVVYEAAGASWLVQITRTRHVDMAVTGNHHIFLGVWYNHWGQGSTANRGGTITAVNVPGGSPTRWMSISTANCQSGDSGGPVYRFESRQRVPKGVISAFSLVNNDCAYVSLGDQLAGTSWTLF